ncbi:MAG: sel1 repeat family protein, partial [Magnetococcales bacterium]|nr:sel1 repeat family protein [Magnetococcales bacterium]
LPDLSNGLDWLRKAAKQGDVEGMDALAWFLFRFSGSESNPPWEMEAVYWANMAISKDYWPAMKRMATFYQAGWGVPRDSDQAKTWEEKALAAGGAKAEFAFFVEYNLGNIFPQDLPKAWFLLNEAAKHGLAVAQWALGSEYLQGKYTKRGYIEPDFLMGQYWLEKSAHNGIAASSNRLGALYDTGLYGFPVDKAKAWEWWEKGVELGYRRSYVSLGGLYVSGVPGHPRDLEKARDLFLKGLEKGDVRAYVQLGRLYYEEFSDKDEQNSRQGFAWYQQGAEKDEEAFALTEYKRLFGHGTTADPDKAMSRLRSAIQHGNRFAADILGKYYFWGEGSAENFQKARVCFVRGVDTDYSETAFWAAFMLIAGLGGPQDVTLAAHFADIAHAKGSITTPLHCLAGGLHLAGSDGVPDLEYGLALLQKGAMIPTTSCAWLLGEGYRQGRYGLPVDLALANHWYEQAATHEDVESMLRLGLLAAGLAGGARESWMNPAEAVRWWQKAGEKGSPPAAFLLGILHAKGLGTPQNLDLARRWLHAAQQQGVERAGHLLALIDSTPESLDDQTEMAAYVSALPASLAPPTIPEELSFFPTPDLPGLPEGFWPRLLVDLQLARQGTSRY